jgi:hypothetical protein
MDIRIQQIIDVVREAGALMDRSGGFEVHDKRARENIVTSSDVARAHCERLLAVVHKHLDQLPY